MTTPEPGAVYRHWFTSRGGLRPECAYSIDARVRIQGLRGRRSPATLGLAVLVYRTLKDHLVYVDPGADVYDAHDRTRVLRRLRQRPEYLGFGLVNFSTGEVVERSVS